MVISWISEKKTDDWIKIFGTDISQSTSIHVECDTYLGVKSVAISYPNGVDFHEEYKWDLDDLIGPNFIMVKRSRKDLYDLLSIKN